MNNNTITIALDAMGGDYSPDEHVKGAVMAVNEKNDITVRLFGDAERIRALLDAETYDEKRIIVVPCESVIENCDSPSIAIRKKKDSSMVRGLFALRNGEADSFISCGNTGALLIGGQTIVGRIRGVERASLAFIVPSLKGPVLILDCGANVDCRADMLLQFAMMGSVYMECLLGKSSPRVGIVNIGEEDYKGNTLVKEAFPLLKECKVINFVGSVESRQVTEGCCDVAVCDGFVGNILLKTYEGVASNMLKIIKSVFMSSFKTKLGAFLVKNKFKESMKQFSIEEYGGAPMLGLKGLVVKTHGNSRAVEIKNTILQCRQAVKEDLNLKLTDAITYNSNL